MLPAGCSYQTDTTPYEGSCAPLAIVGWSPPPQSQGVPTDTHPTVTFSDVPDPDSVSVNSMLLTTGVFRVPQAYRVDLVARAISMQPISNLTPNLGYGITVYPVVRSLAGCTGQFAHAEFTTGDGPTGAAPAAPPTFADIAPILTASCAGNCHAAPDGGCLTAPVAGLSLCASEARAGLIDVPSREVSALALIRPFDSARSYLMRKLVPGDALGGPLPGTLGEREPPGPPLPDSQLRTISAWIDGGALP